MFYLTPIMPQICDSDMFGGANPIAYARWFDRARIEFYGQLLPRLDVRPHGLVTIKSTIEYFKCIDVLDRLVVRSYVSRIGNKSFDLTQELLRGEELCARSVMIFCAMNLETHKGEPLTPERRVVLERFSLSDK